MEAGLSLAEVAGETVSRAAIHYIETGRTRPSWETLQQIARRTRRPIQFFLGPPDSAAIPESEGDMRQLERLTEIRDFPAVIKLGTKALRKRRDRDSLSLIRFYLGQAYCRLVRPSEALPHLRAARESFARLRDDWMLVETMDWEASALGLLEDPSAIDVEYEALRQCRELVPKPPQTEARILGHIAGMHVVSESWAQAVRYYEASLKAAEEVRDILQLAKMHHGLGTAYQRMLKPAVARQHFDLALSLYGMESDLAAVYRVHNDLGFLLLQQGQFEAAGDHLNRALAGCDEVALDRRGRGFILVNLGELACRTGRPLEARKYLTEALRAAEVTGEQLVAADGHSMLGVLEEQAGMRRAADQHFDLALRTLRELGMADRLRECHMRYAELLSNRRDVEGAARHWKAAAEIGRLGAAGLAPESETESAVTA